MENDDKKMTEEKKVKKMKKLSTKTIRRIKRWLYNAAAVGVVVMGIYFIGAIVMNAGDWYDEICYNYHWGKDPVHSWNYYVSDSIYYHDFDNIKGYLYNVNTGKKTLKKVEWVDYDAEGSLARFYDGKKYGFFNIYTGKMAFPEKYDGAFPFSEGLACVKVDGMAKFIDTTGKVVLETGLKYNVEISDVYTFLGGCCIIPSSDGELYGLMDRSGEIVLPIEYDYIYVEDTFWHIWKGNESALLDRRLCTVIPMTDAEIEVDNVFETINVTLPDHVVQKYDMKGNLLYAWCVNSVRMLEYDVDEIKMESSISEDGFGNPIVRHTSWQPRAVAKLRAYKVNENYEGLMTADGQMVTKPIYLDIEAIGHDLYLCMVNNLGENVIVNGKGEVVSNGRQ